MMMSEMLALPPLPSMPSEPPCAVEALGGSKRTRKTGKGARVMKRPSSRLVAAQGASLQEKVTTMGVS